MCSRDEFCVDSARRFGRCGVRITLSLDERDWAEILDALRYRIIDCRKEDLSIKGERLTELRGNIRLALKVDRAFGGITPEKVAVYNALTPEQIKAGRS